MTAASLLTVFVSIGLLAVVPPPAAHAADRAFAARFSTNDTGDIEIYGNTLMSCQTATTGCSAARTAGVGTTTNNAIINNSFDMEYVDVDSDSSTFNSSTSPVSLPAGSTVLFAGLYWGGETVAGSSGVAAPNAAARNTVKFKAPGDAAYSTVTAGTLDDGSGIIYQGFADVTAKVAASGNGTYTVANVQSGTGEDRMAGWSLVIAYRDTTQPARNLSVFDGLKSISSGASGSISVSGFTTPPAGDVRTTVGFVTYEGDMGLVGDYATLNGKTLSDAQHPATNFFNSRSSRDGVLRTGGNPSYANNLGIEQSMLTVDKTYVPNSSTSATIGLSSAGDVYAPGVVTFATELYAPKIEQTKTVLDVNGGNLEQGDVLRYTITGTNSGQDGANGFVLRDPLPSNVTYVPGSMKVTEVTGTTGTRTDASSDDTGDYDAANNRIVVRLGTGANGTTGGSIGVGKSYTVVFDVTVNAGVPNGTSIVNQATATFSSATLGTALTSASAATTTVASPDLKIVKANSGGLVRGSQGTYKIDVSNVGNAPTQGAVTVTDVLPAGLTFVSASGTGWSCTHANGTVTCTRSSALAAGAAYPTISVVVNVTDDVPASVANSATVSGGGDGTPANNTSTDTSVPASRADLALTKTGSPAAPAVGQDVTWTLAVMNNGPSRSTGSTVTDTLGAGLTFVSASTGCTGSAASSTVTCTVGALASGATKTFDVVTKVATGNAGKTLTNAASVAGAETDPVTTDNAATAAVAVKPVDLRITNAVQGSPTALQAGSSYTWLLDAANVGGSPASDTVVRFAVPAGLAVTSAGLDPRCSLQAGDVVCAIGTVAAGATVPQIRVVGTVASGAQAPAAIATNATVQTTETDANPADNAASTTTPVSNAVDLAVALTASPNPIAVGDQLTLTATVTNRGPGNAADPKVRVALPAGTTFVSAPAGCTYDSAAHSVLCTLPAGDLEDGEFVSRAIVVAVGADPASVLTATATATTTSSDPDLSNNTATALAPTKQPAGMRITKTVDAALAGPGDVVTYTLKATNSGPGEAADVSVTDTLPSGLSLVGATTTAGTCTPTGATVACHLGTLASGASGTVTVKASVDPVNGPSDGHDHQLDVTKVENHVSQMGSGNATVSVGCPGGYTATDGSVRFDAVDQGTGGFQDVAVLTSRATSDGTGWTGTVRNGATGQFQGKVNVVCVSSATVSGEGHRHDLVVTPPVTATRALGSGASTVDLACGPQQVAITPGWSFTSGEGVLRTSQRTTAGWRFTVDTTAAADADFEVRCLSTMLSTASGHAHDLKVTPIEDVVSVPAGQTVEKRLTCAGDAKGIVASWDLDAGLVSLGNDPQPVTRVFRFHNPTGSTLEARLGLLCLTVRTAAGTGRDVVNTARLATSSWDATTADDQSSATFRLTSVPQGLTASPRASVVTTAAGTRVDVPVRTTTARRAEVRLLTTSRVGGLAKGTVLTSDSTRLERGKQAVRLSLRGDAARLVRAGKVDEARLVIRTADGGRVTQVVRLVR